MLQVNKKIVFLRSKGKDGRKVKYRNHYYKSENRNEAVINAEQDNFYVTLTNPVHHIPTSSDNTTSLRLTQQPLLSKSGVHRNNKHI